MYESLNLEREQIVAMQITLDQVSAFDLLLPDFRDESRWTLQLTSLHSKELLETISQIEKEAGIKINVNPRLHHEDFIPSIKKAGDNIIVTIGKRAAPLANPSLPAFSIAFETL